MAQNFNDENSLFNFVVKEGNGVKGLVDSGLTEVPPRFIQPPTLQRIDKQLPKAAASSEIMTIDLLELDGPNHDKVVKAIACAAETRGFFQVVNHGVSLDLMESLKAAGQRFFGQPFEKKAVYLKEVSPSPMVKYGTSFKPEREKLAFEWRDHVSMTYTDDAHALEFWPSECREVALEYTKKSLKMLNKLLQILIRNLGVMLDDSRLDKLIGLKTIRMNFYPTCPNPELTVGVRPHTDYGMLTLLLQDGIGGGLYVKKGESSLPGNKEWIKVPFIHGALAINIGDTLQILSNGRYKSAQHMVQTTSIASRVSVPLFISPHPMAKIGPLPGLVARDGVARYREFTFQEYIMKSHNEIAHERMNFLQFASII